MNPIKVFYNGKPLRDIYPHATRWQVIKYRVRRFFRKVFILTGAVIAIVAIFQLGGIMNPKLHYQKVEAEVNTAPVLHRIAGCESVGDPKSKGTHYDKNGQVLMRSNTNKTVDVGKYQINSVWFAKATELGLDITKEADNEAMAKWIYENKGTEDWYSSKNCWK